MPEDIDPKLVDKRVAARYLTKGRLDEQNYEKYLKSLPDLAERAVPIESDLEEEELEEVVQSAEQEPAPQAQGPGQRAEPQSPEEPAPQALAQEQASPPPQGTQPAPSPLPADGPQGS